MRKTHTEPEVAKAAVDYLVSMGYDVYNEVKYDGIGVADIVGVKGKTVWIIEAKVNFGLAVIDQAIRWKCFANLISIVTCGRCNDISIAGKHILKYEGIGFMQAYNFYSYEDFKIEENIRPKLNRKINGKIFKSLHEQQKRSIPGSGPEQVSTIFKRTCELLIQEVVHNPGVTLKEVIDGKKDGHIKIGGIKHHYSSNNSAIYSLKSMIDKGVIKGIRYEGKKMNLYLIDEGEKEKLKEQKKPYGVSDNDPCNRNGCDGKMRRVNERNCSCHINPPCPSCMDSAVICDRCGTESDG